MGRRYQRHLPARIRGSILLGIFVSIADAGETLDNIWVVVQGVVGIGILGIGAYGLFTGKLSGGLRVRASRFNPLRVFRVPGWPTMEAAVTAVAVKPQPEMPYAIVTGLAKTPDNLDVGFEYEVDGVKYENTFTVLVDRSSWSEVTAGVAPGEKVTIRYDPDHPADSVPLEKTWHGWNVWAEG